MSRTSETWPEREFQKIVVQLAEYNGWSVYHVANVRGHLRNSSAVGFPDLVLCKPPRVVIVELKTQKGRITEHQKSWMDRLKASGQDVRLWRPSDWPEIELLFQGSEACP